MPEVACGILKMSKNVCPMSPPGYPSYVTPGIPVLCHPRDTRPMSPPDTHPMSPPDTHPMSPPDIRSMSPPDTHPMSPPDYSWVPLKNSALLFSTVTIIYRLDVGRKSFIINRVNHKE